MTGWRIGWLVVPEGLIRPIERLTQNLYMSPPAISQVAALGAFDGIDELEAIKASYARNRAMLSEELPRAELPAILPADGAFYLYADVSRLTGDSEAFARPCSRTSASRSRRGSISIPSAAGAMFVSVMRDRSLGCARPRAASTSGLKGNRKRDRRAP
jgi:histidinol-phosphate/aromatic aminotransferase/cobyric acid decarboxylase-like protein